jgi:hypothetical protein
LAVVFFLKEYITDIIIEYCNNKYYTKEFRMNCINEKEMSKDGKKKGKKKQTPAKIIEF